jgi:hypothetical protein
MNVILSTGSVFRSGGRKSMAVSANRKIVTGAFNAK